MNQQLRSRGGRARRQKNSLAAPERLAPVERILSPVEVLTRDEVQRIHDASMHILETTGIEFRDEIALEHWKEAGATVKGERVWINRDLLIGLLKKAPGSFEIKGRGNSKPFEMGGNISVFAPMTGAPFVRDLDGHRRASNEQDIVNFARLTQSLPCFQIAGGFPCEPMDWPVPHRHLIATYHHLIETDLPFFGIATSKERSQDAIAMAEIVHGPLGMEKPAVIIGHVSGNSPLVWDSSMLESLRVFVEAGQAVLCSPFVLGAANTPADIAVTVAQVNAEAVAAIAYAQIVKPGARVIYGQYTVSISMQSGAPMAGTPEVSLITTAVGQMARYYGLPWRTTAGHGSSKTFDAQSGYEAATTNFASINAGANMLLHAGGWDEGGLVICYAKFVADAEQNLLTARYAKGISFEHFDDAMAAIERIGPGGHYLGDPFTLEHFKSAFTMPKEMDFSSYEQWTTDGSKDMAERCRDTAKKLLRDFSPPPLDDTVRTELDAFLARRRDEIDPSIV